MLILLLRNHFHFLAYVKSENEIRKHFPYLEAKNIEQIISSQFAHLFNGYAQHFNLSTNRTGKLFELPFRRKLVTSDHYLSKLMFYIHHNAQKHGLTDDFRNYEFSSFKSFISHAPTRLPREEVLKWFGGKKEYLNFHQQDINTITLPEELIFE